MQVKDKVFVVTGGGNGIGREVVLGLLAKGAGVAAVDLSAEGLTATAGLAAAGPRLTTHPLDLRDREAVAGLPAEVTAAHGGVDGLLNVAGIIQPFVPFVELEDEQIEKVMDVNFWGVVHTCRAFLPLLQQRPEAAVVNVSSMGALAPVPGQTVYGASKAAVTLFTQGLYAEHRGTGVAVTVVFPGAVATDITAHSGVTVPGGSAEAPASMTTGREAAEQIITGLEKGSFRVVVGRDARAIDTLARLSPRRATYLIARKMASLLER